MTSWPQRQHISQLPGTEDYGLVTSIVTPSVQGTSSLCGPRALTASSHWAQVVRPDLSNFEEQDNSAWPYLIDEFVDWKRGKTAS